MIVSRASKRTVLPSLYRFDAPRLAVLDEDSGHQGLGMNGEIAPAARGGIEIADRGGDPAAVLVRERYRIAAVGVVAVDIRGEGETVLLHGGERRAAEPAPLLREQAAHRNAPGCCRGPRR